MLHNVLQEARRTLAVLTMTDTAAAGDGEAEPGFRPEVIPRIPWSRIEDQHGESTLEYSFLRHEANQWWVQPGEGWVGEQLSASTERQDEWVPDSLDEQCPYRGSALRRYGRAVEQFREQIWMINHLSGGQLGEKQYKLQPIKGSAYYRGP